MSTNVPLVFHQGNDEVIDVVITPVVPADDLTLITSLRFYLKPDTCTSDVASTVTVLTTGTSAITITAQTPTSLSATINVPSSALADPYPRVWRLDAYTGTTHRTAIRGNVEIIDL
jgi:hypothetical protein